MKKKRVEEPIRPYAMWRAAHSADAIPDGEIIDVQENERNEYVVDERQLDPRRLYVKAIYFGNATRAIEEHLEGGSWAEAMKR